MHVMCTNIHNTVRDVKYKYKKTDQSLTKDWSVVMIVCWIELVISSSEFVLFS